MNALYKIFLFVKRCLNWIKGYVHWKREQLQQMLRKHSDWYDSQIVVKDARKRLLLDKRKYLKKINGIREFCAQENTPFFVVKERDIAHVVRPEYYE